MIDRIDWHAVKVLARKEIRQVLNFRKPTAFIIAVSIMIILISPILTPVLTLLGFPPAGRPLLEGTRYVAKLLMPFFLLYPPMITNTIVSESLAGEKERHTIESLLLLPCSTSVVLIAKAIVALLPAFLFILGGFLSIGIISNISIASYGTIIMFNEVEWYVTVFLAAPIFVMMYNLCGILASIVARSVKGAQFLAGIPSAPQLVMLMVIMVENITLTTSILLAISGACLLINLGLFWLCLRAFDREKFLLQSD